MAPSPPKTAIRLNLGCGAQVVEGWVNVDYSIGARFAKIPLFGLANRKLKLFNIDWDKRIRLHDLRKPLPWNDGAVDCIYTSHTLEHFSRDEGRRFLQECHRVLRAGGVLRVVVPDLAAIVADYQSGKLPADRFLEELGVLHDIPGSAVKRKLAPLIQYPHRCMYDGPTLLSIIGSVGFVAAPKGAFESRLPDIELLELEERTENAVIVEGEKA